MAASLLQRLPVAKGHTEALAPGKLQRVMVSMKIMKLLVASGTAEACDNKTHEAPEESMRDQASSAGENVCGPYSEFPRVRFFNCEV